MMGEAFLVRRTTKKEKDSVIYFYNKGDECIGVTGGWVTGYASGNATLSKESDHLKIAVANNPSGTSDHAFVTDVKVSLDNISALYIDWEVTNISINPTLMRVINFLVGNNKNDNIEQREAFTSRVGDLSGYGRSLEALDVSALSGEYYLRVHARDVVNNQNAPFDLKIYRIWGVE